MNIRYEIHFQSYICDTFFPELYYSYSSVEEARKKAKSESRMRAYRIVECVRKIVEEKTYENLA